MRRGTTSRVVWPAALVASVVLAMSSTHVQLSGRVKPYVVECFLVLVLGFNLFGDGLRDVLDPSLRSV